MPEDAGTNRVGTVGAVLAGGAGRRIGGDKAVVALEGRPLLQWVIDALQPVTGEVAVVAKVGTLLPQIDPDVSIWLENEPDFHPLIGIVHALKCAQGRAVLVVAADMPLLTTEVLARLSQSTTGAGAVARVNGRVHPLCARYEPGALEQLADFEPGARVTDTVLALGVDVIDFEDPLPFFNVNAPEDLLTAGAELKRRDSAAD